MRIYFLILSFLISAAGIAQTPNYLYGRDVIITTRDTSSAELTIRNTTRNVLGYFKNIGGGKGRYTLIPQIDVTGLPDSLLARYTKTQSDARYKPIAYFPSWAEITGIPANFSTTYALSNDVRDSIQSRVNTFGPQSVGGYKTFTADTTRFNIAVSNKSMNGGADTLFAGDPYVGPINTTKTGFIHHYYGISDNQNGGGDITYFKENGINYNKLPTIADRRVLPGREIWYEQYSAHNGVDSIYSRRSIAAIAVARASSNSTLGNMRGWYEIVTARDSGYKTPPTTKDFIVSEGRMAVNAPSDSTNATFTSTANIYGDLLATNGLISNSLILRNSPLSTQFETYVNGSALATRIVGNAFDNMQLRNGGARPLLVRTSSSNPPLYLYNDASGGGLTISETEITGYYQTLTSGAFNIANAEIFRFNNSAGVNFGVNTGNALNATFHVRGSTSATRAFLVSNNANAELFRVNNNGAVLVGGASDDGLGGIRVTGRGLFSSTVSTPTLSITATADSSILFRYPAELKTLYRENSLYPNNFGFNIVNSQSNSFFTYTEEGLAHQAYYKGDGDGNTNIWGVSSKLNTDTGWIPRIVVSQNGFVGIGTNAPLNELTVNGNLSVIGANNSITTRGSLGLVTGSFQSDNTGTFFGTNTNHPLFFRINAAEVARISTAGNWLIKGTTDNGIDAVQITGTSLTRGRAEILAPSLGEYFRAGGGTVSDRSLRFTSYTIGGTAGVGHQINAPNANANLALAVGGVDRLTIFETGVAAFSNRVQATQFRLSALNTAPSSATDTGLTGEIRIDANFIYICTATNTWKRVAISTW